MNKVGENTQVRIQRGIPVWGFIDLDRCYEIFKNMCGKIETVEIEEDKEESSIQLEIRKIRYLRENPPIVKKSMETEQREEWAKMQRCNRKWMKVKFGQDFRGYLSKSIIIQIAAREKNDSPIFEQGLMYIFKSGFIAVDFMSPQHRLTKFTASKIDRFKEVRDILEYIYSKLKKWNAIMTTDHKLNRSSFIGEIYERNEESLKYGNVQITSQGRRKLMLDGDKGAHSYHHIRTKKQSPKNEKDSSLYPIGKFHLNFKPSFINIFTGDEECPVCKCDNIWKSTEISLLTYGIIRILAIQSWLIHGIQSCQVWLSLLPQTLETTIDAKVPIAKQTKENLPTLNPFTWYERRKAIGKGTEKWKKIEKKIEVEIEKWKKIEVEIEKWKKIEIEIEKKIEIEIEKGKKIEIEIEKWEEKKIEKGKKEKMKIEKKIEKRKKEKMKIEKKIEKRKKEKMKIEKKIEKRKKEKMKIEKKIEKRKKEKMKIEKEIEKEIEIGKMYKLLVFFKTLAYFVDLIYDDDIDRLSYLILEGKIIGELAIESIADTTRIFLDHRLYPSIISKSQIIEILDLYGKKKAVDQKHNMYESMAEFVPELAKNVKEDLSESQKLIQDAKKVSIGYGIGIATTFSAVITLLLGVIMLLDPENENSKSIVRLTFTLSKYTIILLLILLVISAFYISFMFLLRFLSRRNILKFFIFFFLFLSALLLIFLTYYYLLPIIS